ncbi:hypothetical protein CBR_g46605 [Chara braunii]|uniref:Uncharacterized protein n=1 Tax=Chara braunii TaxID=69332 RepID=A0A388M0N7_CHABU|nr:hypothetical protein CBR_g46605 [Chara braunii]|eukprot:GBG88116.1 hypothetical protein CBR_g46605 [Chara braunii]
MLPITFIFLSARPVVDMRIWNEDASSFSVATARRAGMVNGTAKKAAHTLCLQATRCKLEGLDFIMKPSDFILGVNGVLFADRSAGSTRLKGSVALSVDLGSIPEAISATPQPLIEGVGDLVGCRPPNILMSISIATLKSQLSLAADSAEYHCLPITS